MGQKYGICPICGKRLKYVAEHLIRVHGFSRNSNIVKTARIDDRNREYPSPAKLRKRRKFLYRTK